MKNNITFFDIFIIFKTLGSTYDILSSVYLANLVVAELFLIRNIHPSNTLTSKLFNQNKSTVNPPRYLHQSLITQQFILIKSLWLLDLS